MTRTTKTQTPAEQNVAIADRLVNETFGIFPLGSERANAVLARHAQVIANPTADGVDGLHRLIVSLMGVGDFRAHGTPTGLAR